MANVIFPSDLLTPSGFVDVNQHGTFTLDDMTRMDTLSNEMLQQQLDAIKHAQWAKPPMTNPLLEPRMRELMVAMRLRDPMLADALRGNGMAMSSLVNGFKTFMTAYEENGEKVFVFLLHKGKPVVLEDPAELFPSDALVTQLIMLRDSQ